MTTPLATELDHKQAIVLRKEKMVAQGAHASLRAKRSEESRMLTELLKTATGLNKCGILSKSDMAKMKLLCKPIRKKSQAK